jgi:hypothetical protein
MEQRYKTLRPKVCWRLLAACCKHSPQITEEFPESPMKIRVQKAKAALACVDKFDYPVRGAV